MANYPQVIRFEFGEDWINIEIVSPAVARLNSNLCAHTDGENPDDDDWSEYNSAVDGMESLLIAMAISGVDLTAPEMKEAVLTAIEGIANHAP